jgi:hypothetical protein
MTDEQLIDRKAYYLRQSDVAYDANGGASLPRSQACSTCRWFKTHVSDDIPSNGAYGCQIVESYPLPIVPNGWCDQWAAIPEYKPEPQEVVIVEVESDTDVGQMSIDKDGETAQIKGKGLIDRVLGLFKPTPSDQPPPSFKALGDGFWFAAFTNNFQDRDQEILSRKAHEKYVRRVQMGLVDMPELWIHHIPGTRHGKALYVGMTDHTVYAVGKFDDTPLGAVMEKTYAKAKPGTYGLSHGFTYPQWAKQDKVYHDYNTFEITTLLPHKASNPYTPFMAIPVEKDLTIMPLSDTEKQKIQQQFPGAVGENIVNLVDQTYTADEQVKSLLGAKYKDFADATDKTEVKAAETDEAVKALIPTLFEGHLNIDSLVKAMDKRIDAQDKELAAVKAENVKVQAALALKPTPASQSDQTLLDQFNAMTDDEKKELAAAKMQLDQKRGDQPYAAIFPDLFTGKP